MFCTNCGKELNPGDRFCANCGCEIKASQSEKRKYDNVVFNPPFRKEADKRTAQILKSREEFTGFKEIAKENSKRNARSKAKMDWNLEGFPESITAKNKSGFDWNSVVERRNSGRSMGMEKIDLSSTIEHKKIDDAQVAASKAAPAIEKENLGLPPEDSRVISLEELEKELYDLEEDLKTDTAGTNQYQPFDVQNDEELDAYLDGIPKTKKPEKEAEEEKLEAEAVKAVKLGGPMKWNLQDETPKGTKVSMEPMGLKWGIDASEVAARRKAAKTAIKKEREMVWNVDKKAQRKPEEPREPQPEPQPEPQQEPVQEPVQEPTLIRNTFKEPEIVQPEPEPIREPEVKTEAEPSFDFSSIKAPSWDINDNKREDYFNFETEVHKEEPAPAVEEAAAVIEEPVPEIVEEPAPVIEAEPVPEVVEEPAHVIEAEPVPEVVEEPAPVIEAEPVPEMVEEAAPETDDFQEIFEESASETEVESEFKDMLLNDEQEDLEKTRMIDHSAIKQMLEEYKLRLREEQSVQQEAETVSEESGKESGSIAEEVAGIAAAAGLAAAAERPLFQEDLIHPWESKEEPAADEPVHHPETAEVQPEEAPEEVSPEAAEPVQTEEELPVEPIEYEPYEEPAAPEVTEPEAAPETEEETSEEKPMFYTFSQKNEAFQQLLQRERDRLNGLGSEYMPLNADTKVEKIVKAVESPAYEENGVFVETILQPLQTTVADLSGDPKPDKSSRKYSFMTDGDWLRELKSSKDMDSANKAKLRYSDLFPTPVREDDIEEYGPADDEEAMKEKQRKAEELDKIFENDTNEERPRHIVGNIIMILLILLILFEGSVLAAKLIAPDSKYAHISDVAVEKILNLFGGNGGESDEESTEPTGDVDINDSAIEEGSYIAMINDLSKNADTIGQVSYNDGLNYSIVSKSAFDGVEKLETLKDSEWTKDGDKVTTYAGGIFASIIDYYNEWKDRNTDENLVGIDSLEIGEIKQGENGYYALTKTTYATKDSGKVATYQTCYVSLLEGSMFIEEIKGETVNEQ